jgi:integrase
MPRLARPIDDLIARRSKPKAKPYVVAGGRGLYLRVNPSGSRVWEVRYRHADGKQGGPVQIGLYPQMSCAKAREAADAVHVAALRGDPILGMRDEKDAKKRAADEAARRAYEAELEAKRFTFEVIGHQWLEHRKAGWATETYRKARLVLNSHLIPSIGELDIRTIGRADVKPVLLRMAAAVPVLARKARQYLNGIVEFAIDERIRGEDQVLRLARVLPTHKGGHVPAITHASELGDLLRAVAGHPNAVMRHALNLTALTALRPGIIASLRWSEVDLEAEELRIAGSRMKTGHAHIVSLPAQAIEILQALKPISGAGEYVLPPLARQKSPHLHRDSMSAALRDLGFRGRHATHGYRATLRTVGRERLGIDVDVLEAQLAHAKKDEVAAAYDRTGFIEQRRRVMQEWADFLDEQRDGVERRPGKVTPIKRSSKDISRNARADVRKKSGKRR